jgi:hypothetical protein
MRIISVVHEVSGYGVEKTSRQPVEFTRPAGSDADELRGSAPTLTAHKVIHLADRRVVVVR